MILPLLLLLAAEPASAAEQPADGSEASSSATAVTSPRISTPLPAAPSPDPKTGEFPVAPYTPSEANAGARPFAGSQMAAAFGGQAGIRRIADRTVALSEHDPRIADIFVNQDLARLRRTLFEQFCYILGAGCSYSGRDMAAAHRNMGIRMADMNALVENLQQAMREEKVPFPAQNRLLAKLAPMDRQVIERR